MTLLGLVLLLIVAAIAGSAGMALAGFPRGGLLAAIVIGFVGAYVGVWLAGQLGLPLFLVLNVGGQPFALIWAIIGAFILCVVLGFLFHGRRRYV